jgi:hypothetical protein
LGPAESTLRVGTVEYEVQAEMDATSAPAGARFECRR